MMHKRVGAQCKQETRLAGSLPREDRTSCFDTHNAYPQKKKREHGRHMRATSKPGVIERLQTLYSHLSTHAKSSCNICWDEAVCRLLSTSVCCAVPGKRGAVTQIDDNFLLTSADNNRAAEAEKIAADV